MRLSVVRFSSSFMALNMTLSSACLSCVNAGAGRMFGNDSFFGKTNQIEVQIFYKLDIDFDLDEFETRLMKFLVSEHYKITDIREHSIDPDTYQLTGVFYVEREKILKGE